jgi:hypothetical protein
LSCIFQSYSIFEGIAKDSLTGVRKMQPGSAPELTQKSGLKRLAKYTCLGNFLTITDKDKVYDFDVVSNTLLI